jgi:phosphate transport system substrate-binding protein
MSVSPNFSLVDGQQVIVRWAGFPKDSLVWIHVCERGATSVTRCTARSQSPDRKSDIVSVYSVSSSKGIGSENITVVVTDANHGLAGAPDVKCDVDNPCDVVVNESSTTLDGGARQTISFAPAATCPDPGALRATGVGSDASELALEEWSSVLCQAPYNVALGYTAKNDVSGRSDYQCKNADFAVVEYRPDYENDTCPATTPGGKDTKRPVTRLAPVTLSPVVIAFNMRDQLTGLRVDRLVLTPDLLAEIFTGKLYSAQDPRIKALNLGVNLPVNIRAIARADQAGINYTLTRFLNAAAPKAYKAGGKLFQYGATDSLANVNGLDLRTGGTYVGKAVLYPENDPRTTPWGFLGVMDASTAARYGLSTVTLKMGAGSSAKLVEPNAASVLTALQGIAPDKYGYFDIPAMPAPQGAWPMVTVGYVVPPASDSTALARAAVGNVVQFATEQGQKSGLLPAGYVPLPDVMRAQAAKAISTAGPDTDPVTAPASQSTNSTGDQSSPTTSGTSGVGSGSQQFVQLASVFDRQSANGSGTWLWGLLMLTGAASVVYLIRNSKGARE